MAYAQPFPTAVAPGKKSEAPPGAAPDAAQTVFLLVKLNGNQEVDLLPFTETDGRVYIAADVAMRLGFSQDYIATVPAGTPLDAYPDVKVEYDRGQQSLSITAPLSVLDLDTAVIGAKAGARVTASAAPGLVMNYDVYSSYTDQRDVNISGFADLRAFNNLGMFGNSFLWQGQHTHTEPGWRRTVVRMDSVLERSLEDKQVSMRLGDTVTNGVSWSRSTRIGGFQIARNFALQPYQTTTPLPAYFGSAALPSSVELFVNGIQQYSGKVPAGPFELNTLPTVNGAGQAQVVLTDALGRRTSIDFPFYSSSRLLRKGLTDWSFETGYVRKDYGFNSFAYGGEPMMSATVRHGFSNVLTGESHLEGSKSAAAGGVGVVVNIGQLGLASGAWAQSAVQGERGGQYSLGYQLQRGPFNLGANTQRTVKSYRDVASLYGGVPVVRNDSAYLSFSAGALGNVGVNYTRLQLADQPRYRYAGANWSRAFGHGISVNLSMNQNLDNRSDRSIFLGLSFNWDKGISAFGSAVRAQDAMSYSAGVTRSAPTPDGWSWGVQAQQSGQQDRAVNVQTSTRARYADLSAGANSSSSGKQVNMGAAGSIVAMGGGVFASRRIYDSFAVVSTAGVPNVPVNNQNRLEGVTDSKGYLLVPSLQSYQHNKVSIDPSGLPVDARIDRVTTDVVPRRGSGLNVLFKIETVHAASLILKLPDGQEVPMGMAAYLNGGSEPAGWVGYDSRAYLEGLQAENHVEVRGENFKCVATFPYQAQANTVPEIGPLLCEP